MLHQIKSRTIEADSHVIIITFFCYFFMMIIIVLHIENIREVKIISDN
jgi:hypothetical protein